MRPLTDPQPSPVPSPHVTHVPSPSLASAQPSSLDATGPTHSQTAQPPILLTLWDSSPFPINSLVAHQPPHALLLSPNTLSIQPSFPNQSLMMTRSQRGIFKPKHQFNLTTTVPKSPLPHNPLTAFRDPNWKMAMNDEFDALIKNETWDWYPVYLK